jgi:hypothetical protein
VVGHGDGLLTELGNAIYELFDVASAVEEGVFSMQMKMSKFGHGYGLILVVIPTRFSRIGAHGFFP